LDEGNGKWQVSSQPNNPSFWQRSN